LQEATGQVSVVRLRPPELVIRRERARAACRGRPTRKVLQLPATTDVTDLDVQLAVGTEVDHTAVVVRARRLGLVALARRLGRAVVLERAELDQVAVVVERESVPAKAVDAVPEQRHA
jgi:hypothetical protein